MANKPLQKYGTRILVKMFLTATHRFTSEDKYIDFDFYLTTQAGDYLMTQANDYLMLNWGE